MTGVVIEQLIKALRRAESFISGFEGDDQQDGIEELVAEIRSAITLAPFSGEEDAFIVALRTQDYTWTTIAELVEKRFGRKCTAAEIGDRLKILAAREMRGTSDALNEALTMTGLSTLEELIDMANVGQSLMNAIETYTKAPSLIEGWSPADDPAEIVGDLYNRFEESFACHKADLERLKAAEAALAGVDTYDRGRRDVLNAILALNKDAAAGLAALHERESDPDGKLPFDVVYWVTFVAGQLGIAERIEEGADA